MFSAMGTMGSRNWVTALPMMAVTRSFPGEEKPVSQPRTAVNTIEIIDEIKEIEITEPTVLQNLENPRRNARIIAEKPDNPSRITTGNRIENTPKRKSEKIKAAIHARIIRRIPRKGTKSVIMDRIINKNNRGMAIRMPVPTKNRIEQKLAMNSCLYLDSVLESHPAGVCDSPRK